LSSIRDDFSEPRNLRRWETKTIKGGFYFNEALNGIVSNSFALDLDRESSVFISIESFTTDLHEGIDWEDLDASVLVVKNSSNLILKGLTENKIDKVILTSEIIIKIKKIILIFYIFIEMVR